MDLEFKGIMIYSDPRLKTAPLVKILPETLKTEENLAKLIRFELEEKAGVAKFAKTAWECYEEDRRCADEKSRKHRIFIKCNSYGDFPRYVRDLIDALYERGITCTRLSYRWGEVETAHVIAKMIPPMMNRDGLRCDECFGFSYDEGKRLKNSYWPGFEKLTSVPTYIEEFEKEKTKEMYLHMNYDPVARACAAIFATKKPTIKDVIFNDPATIIMWSDGTKTVVKAENEAFDPEKGLAMAISKKNLGNKYDYYNTFKHWIKKYYKEHPERDAEWTVAAKPVQKAYQALVNIMSTKGTKLNTKPALEEAIEEALGFLGEALDD